MSKHIKIFEVGPRDGLQNEERIIPTSEKVKLIDKLSDCGFSNIEVSSFVSAKWVPQLSDASKVFSQIMRKPGVSYAALTPNLRGYNGAIAAGADEVAIFGSASEGFSQKNINCSISESITRFIPVLKNANVDNIKVRGYISCVTDCPYDGPTAPERVVGLAVKLLNLGCYEISLGDTIGAATPDTTEALVSLMLNYMPAERLAGHFHDTEGRALQNIEVCLDHGIKTFDSSIGGLGGCPYAEGAKGNVDTLSVVEFLSDKGYETGLDVARLRKTQEFAQSLIGTQHEI